MRLSDLPLDFSGILSNAMWVGQGKIYFDYKEEVKQNTGGYAYECLCPNLAYSKVMVKVPGEQKALLKYTGKPIPVMFEGLSGRAYQNFRKGGEIELSVFAKKISALEKNNVRLGREA